MDFIGSLYFTLNMHLFCGLAVDEIKLYYSSPRFFVDFKIKGLPFLKRYEICSKLAINAPETSFLESIVNFKHITHFSSGFIFQFEQVNVSWVGEQKDSL